MAYGPIPWTAINDYALRYGIEGEAFEEFVFMIRVIDDVYIETASKKDK